MDDIKKQTGDFLRLGGSVGQSITAARLERFSGVNAGAVGGAIRGGGIATGIGAQFGISPISEAFGGPSDSQAMIQVMKKLADMDYTTARRYAAGLGNPELAKISLLDKSTQDRLLKSQEYQNDPKTTKTNATLEANLSILGTSFDRLFKLFAGPISGVAARGAAMLADVMERMAPITNLLAKSMSGFMVLLEQFFDLIDNGKRDGSYQDKLDKNTKALDDLTHTMKDGMYGGKGRAARSVPGGVGAGADAERMRVWMNNEYGFGLL